jgi:AraC family transcriptional regulator
MKNMNQPDLSVTPDEWAGYMPAPAVLSSETTGWTKISARRYQHPPAEFEAPALSDHLIWVSLAGPTNVRWKVEGKAAKGQLVPGQISVLSANKTNGWWWDGRPDVFHVYMNAGFFEEIALQAEVQKVELIDHFGVDDPAVRQICLTILKELTSIGFAGRLYGDFLAQALAVQLLRRHCVIGPKIVEAPVALPAYKLRRALEFIDAHLAEDICVSNIAEAASISTFHFAHAFKRATGHAPHQFVIKRRIERAKELLRQTDLPIMEIAMLVGFSTQNHFTTVFGKVCGATPKQYRNSVKS